MCRQVYGCAAIVTIVTLTVWVICHYSAHPGEPLHQGKLHQHQSNFFNLSIHSPSSDIVHAGQKIFNHKYGFVMALTYSGQQGAGIQALMSLQCFVGSFSLPMEIVEPVISSTRFESFSSSTNNHSLVTFSDMFDRKHFNDISVDAGLARLISQEEFAISYPGKTAILVIIQRSETAGSKNNTRNSVDVVWSSELCYPVGKFKNVEILKHTGFCVQRVISITQNGLNKEVFTENDLFETFLGPLSPRSVTLIFNTWHTPWYVRNSKLQNPSQCQQVKVKSRKPQFRPSPRLLADGVYYRNHFLNSSKSLAIMLRLERMILKFRKREDIEYQVQKCLAEVTAIATDLRPKENLRGSGGSVVPFVTLDLGRYGSGSWGALVENGRIDKNIIIQSVKDTLSTIYKQKWSFKRWETSFTEATKGLETSGYIAALQRTLASQSECIVLAGGGNFQELAMRDYMRNHPDKGKWCIHFVCAIDEDRLKGELQQSLTTLRFNSI